MFTYFEDEFGELCLVTEGSLESCLLHQELSSSSESSVSMDLRIQEMYHFLSVLSLFNPKINSHGLPQIVSSQTEPQE